MHFCETDRGWLSLNRKPTLCRAKLAILGFVVCLWKYDTRCYIKVRSKANMSQLNLPHATDN